MISHAEQNNWSCLVPDHLLGSCNEHHCFKAVTDLWRSKKKLPALKEPYSETTEKKRSAPPSLPGHPCPPHTHTPAHLELANRHTQHGASLSIRELMMCKPGPGCVLFVSLTSQAPLGKPICPQVAVSHLSEEGLAGPW